jgi:hypothetical protein
MLRVVIDGCGQDSLALLTPALSSEPQCSEDRGMRLGAEKAESLDCTAIVQSPDHREETLLRMMRPVGSIMMSIVLNLDSLSCQKGEESLLLVKIVEWLEVRKYLEIFVKGAPGKSISRDSAFFVLSKAQTTVCISRRDYTIAGDVW